MSAKNPWDDALKDPAFVASLEEGIADMKAGRTVKYHDYLLRAEERQRVLGELRERVSKLGVAWYGAHPAAVKRSDVLAIIDELEGR